MTSTELNKRNQLQLIQQQLIARRNALRRTLEGDRRMLRAGHDSGVGDEIDAAIATEQAELSSQMASFESRELARIEHALDKIRAGHYGRCETCDKPIAPVRLKALTYATECIVCARREERRGTVAGGSSPVNRIAAFSSSNEAEPRLDDAEFEEIR